MKIPPDSRGAQLNNVFQTGGNTESPEFYRHIAILEAARQEDAALNAEFQQIFALYRDGADVPFTD